MLGVPRGSGVLEGLGGLRGGIRDLGGDWGGYVKSCSTAVVSFSFLKWSGRGSGVQGGHWIMVYECGYEYGFGKRKDQRT